MYLHLKKTHDVSDSVFFLPLHPVYALLQPIVIMSRAPVWFLPSLLAVVQKQTTTTTTTATKIIVDVAVAVVDAFVVVVFVNLKNEVHCAAGHYYDDVAVARYTYYWVC